MFINMRSNSSFFLSLTFFSRNFGYLIIIILLSFSQSLSLYSQSFNKYPNILLILTDDQGYHDVSYYGTKDLQTPNIDRIALGGMRFDQFYANCPVCSPTRAALLTGRYQDYVGVPGVIRTNEANSWGYLALTAQLLPTHLTQAAYHTAIIGKWHLGLTSPNTPVERGFDYFHGWLGDMMDDYWTHRRHGINYMRLNGREIDPEGHATDLFTDWAVNYIQDQADDDRPFFLYLAYNAPHFPVQPPEDWLANVFEREQGIDSTRAKLVAFIEHMDAGIGKVVQALKATGQYEHTIIIFSSDNGGHLPSKANNGPLRDGKQSMYEGGLKVPTAISWPEHIPPGSISEEVHLTMDLFPTLLELADIPIPSHIEGRSFLSELTGDVSEQEVRPIYFSRREGGLAYGGRSYYAVRMGHWKLLQHTPFSPYELYHLERDPLEEHNLVEEEPLMLDSLNKLLMRHIQLGGKVPWQETE